MMKSGRLLIPALAASVFCAFGGESVVLENHVSRLVFRDGALREFSRKGAAGCLRDLKTFELLLPTAKEEPSNLIRILRKDSGVEILREGDSFTLREFWSLPEHSGEVSVDVTAVMKKPLKIGIIRCPKWSGSISGGAILSGEERELRISSTAGELANLGPDYSFYHGIYNDAAKNGFLILVPENRNGTIGYFSDSGKQPGRLHSFFEIHSGPFGELKEVRAGDRLDFRFRLLPVGEFPEKELNELCPGASEAPKSKTGPDGKYRVFLDPSYSRDDGKLLLLKDFPNALSFLIYRADRNVPDGEKLQLRLELPWELVLEKTVCFQYWLPGKIDPAPKGVPEEKNGKRIWTYLLDLPDPVRCVAEKNSMVSLEQHQLLLYLNGAEPGTRGVIRWQLKTAGNETGEFHDVPFEILPDQWRGNEKVPKRMELWYEAEKPMRHLIWADGKQRNAYLELFRSQGITCLAKPETNAGLRPESPDLCSILRGKGFRIHAPYEFLRFAALKNLDSPAPGSVWTTLNGKCVYWGDNPQHSFCPSYLLRTDTPLHRELAKEFSSLDGVDFMWLDWEGKTFQGCYCPECRMAFAAFSGVPAADAERLPPVDLIRKYPLEWIRFRHHQSALMFRMIRGLANRNGKQIKSGMDYLLVDPEVEFPGLGRGRALFCEDPRLMKEADFDFVLPDALWSGPMAYDQVEASVRETEIPVYPKTGCVGGLGFSTGAWICRRLLADFQRRGLGMELWPELVRVVSLAHAASGAKGIVLGGFPVDGGMQMSLIRLARDLAVLEDDFLDGKEITDQCGLFLLPSGKTVEPDTLGKDLIYVGSSPENVWRCRILERGERILISLFHFGVSGEKNLRVVFDTPPERGYVSDPLTGIGILSPSGRELWDGAELRKGVVVSVGKMDAGFLLISREKPLEFRKNEMSAEPGAELPRKRPVRTGKIEDQVENEIRGFPFGGL